MNDEMTITQFHMSQDKLFTGLIKHIKDENTNKLSLSLNYTFYDECSVAIERELKEKLKVLDGQGKTMTEMYQILNQFFKNSSIYQVNIAEGYIGCIERVGRNNWRSYKLLGYKPCVATAE